MQPLTSDWIQKAEGDFVTAGRELRARKLPNHNACCFHAQQCAEKYLKARLQEAQIRFPKTHDLLKLLELVLQKEPFWETLRPALTYLNEFAVSFRYPGESADKATAKEAFGFCAIVRKEVRHGLFLKS